MTRARMRYDNGVPLAVSSRVVPGHTMLLCQRHWI